MPEPMSEERLAEHRAMRDQTRGWGPEEVDTVWDFHAEAVDEIERLRAENERLESWVSDLQSGMYVNCVYCGHRYGPGETTPVSMADALKTHVEQCPKHPMSALKAEVERLREVLRDIAYNTSTSIPFAAPPETYIVGQLHSCIGRAARALNPEPSA